MNDAEALALAAAARKRQTEKKKGLWGTVLDNVVGYGDVDTPGERLGVMIRDSVNAAESGARSTLAAAADLPGMAFNFLGGRAADALEGAGVVSPQTAESVKQSLAQGPFGTGTSVRDGVNRLTGNSLEYQPQTLAGEYARTVGEFLPGAYGGFVPYALAPGLAAETAGQLTEGKQFPDSVPVLGGRGVEPYARFAGAMAGPTIYNAGRRAITPNPADPARIEAAKRLEREGIRTTAGQKTGNRRLTYAEEGSPRTSDMIVEQNERFTEAALRRIGARDPQTLQPAKRATPEVLRLARDDIGNLFDEVTNNLTVRPIPRTLAEMDKAASEYAQLTAKSNIAPIIDNIRSKVSAAIASGKPITGAEYQQWRSQLSKATTGQDSQLASAARSFIRALDDAAERSMPNKAMIEKFATARRRWRDFLAIRDAATMAGEDVASGIISPRQLRGKVTSGAGKSSYATGERDLGNLTRDANAVLPRITDPQQDRMLAESMARGIGIGGSSSGLAYALTKDPAIASGAASAGLVLPAVYQKAVGTAPLQRYLSNQLVTGSDAPFSAGLTAAALAASLGK